MNEQEEILKPEFDTRKSFYGKAKIVLKDNEIVLLSYNTKVAYICNGRAYVLGLFSNTTTRHIKEFLKQKGFRADTSKQIIKDYGGNFI